MKRVNLSDFSNELGSFSKASLAEQKKAVVAGVARSLPELAATSPVDTGLYAASWDMSVQEQSVIAGNYAPYAGIIEDGARPFIPPIAPLLAWAKRVLQDSSQPPNYSSRVWALARGTQKKIAAEGMQPRHILQNMIPTIIQNIREEFEHAK